MLDDLFQADNLRGAQDLIANPKPLPKPSGPAFSAWKLTTAAPRGVAAGAAQSGGFFADVLGAFGQVGGATYTGDMFGNMTDQQRQQTDQAAQKLRTQGMDFSSEGGDLLRGVAKGYSPDPESAHTAERLVFEFARFATKAVGYTVAGGPVVGPVLTGTDEGMAAADELKHQGVDIATRTKAGAIIGVVSGLSVALPMAGRTAAETAALVATGGPLSFIGQQQAVRSILQAADYSNLSEQYDPFDPVGLAVSTLVPAAFGVHGLRVNRAAAAAKVVDDFRSGPVPSEETPTAAAAREAMTGRPADEHVDAARTLLALEQRREASPFRPDDWRGYDLHETAMARAIDQIAAGQRVDVTDLLANRPLDAARVGEMRDQIEGGMVPRAESLSPIDRGIESRLADRVSSDFEGAVHDYSALPDSEGGRVLNVDIARELSPDYMADRTKSAAVHEPASQFIKDLYARKLAEPPVPDRLPIVLFTAGGTGAGKSTAIKNAPGVAALAERAQIVYDTNMNTYDSAKAKVEQALEAGKDVHIAMVVRDPVDALVNGALPRAERQRAEFGTGRTVPLSEHIKTHLGAADVVQRLAAEYADNPHVRVSVVDNNLGKGAAAQRDVSWISQIKYNDIEQRVAAALEREREAGRISAETYAGFAGKPAQGNSGLGSADASRAAPEAGRVPQRNRPGTGEQPEPQRPGAQVADQAEAAANSVRLERITSEHPDLLVQLDGMDKSMRLADVLAAVKAEADDMKLDGDLMQAAAECALLNGW